MLAVVSGVIPVPAVLATGPGWLRMATMPGTHGQDLIDAGLARQVLTACGRTLRRLHDLDPPAALSEGNGASGAVLVHGDFGPNNVLLDGSGAEVTAVLDWEWAHLGDPVEDLAWCEFIVRMHHPAAAPAVNDFFAAYGSLPAWTATQHEILRRCRELADWCELWQPGGDGVREWERRAALVQSWPQ